MVKKGVHFGVPPSKTLSSGKVAKSGSWSSDSLSRARAKVYTRASLHPRRPDPLQTRFLGGLRTSGPKTPYIQDEGLRVAILRGPERVQNGPFQGSRDAREGLDPRIDPIRGWLWTRVGGQSTQIALYLDGGLSPRVPENIHQYPPSGRNT